jgi:hypothetical protein
MRSVCFAAVPKYTQQLPHTKAQLDALVKLLMETGARKSIGL